MQAALFDAVSLPRRFGCLAAIYAALEAGASIGARNADGLTPLHWAVLHNPDAAAIEAAIAVLAAEGADVNDSSNSNKESPLHLTADNLHAEAAGAAVRALVKAGCNVNAKGQRGLMPLHYVAQCSSAAVARAAIAALVAVGADVHCRDEVGDVPQHKVAWQSSSEAAAAVVQALAAAGGDANAKDSNGFTALHCIAQHVSMAVAEAAVAALVAAGADVHSQSESGLTALHMVAWQSTAEGAAAAMQALLAAGANANAADSQGHCTLHAVAQSSTAAVAPAAVRALVSASADVRCKSDKGGEPLHYAAQHNKDGAAAAAVAAALLAAGADPQALDGDGKRAAELVVLREDAASCFKLLRTLLGPAHAAYEAGGAMPLCPTCFEPAACMTGPCGHLVCEDCATDVKVRQMFECDLFALPFNRSRSTLVVRCVPVYAGAAAVPGMPQQARPPVQGLLVIQPLTRHQSSRLMAPFTVLLASLFDLAPTYKPEPLSCMLTIRFKQQLPHLCFPASL